jgi:ATP-dependent Lon protease
MLTRNRKRLLEEESPEQKRKKKRRRITIVDDDKEEENIVESSESSEDSDFDLCDNTSTDKSDIIFDEDYEENEDDSNEKLGLKILESTDPIAYKQFIDIRQELMRLEPSIVEILKSDLKLKDKARIFELYEIFKVQPRPSNEYVEARGTVRATFKQAIQEYKQYMEFGKEKVEALKKKKKSLNIQDPVIGLKLKILSLNTNQENMSAIYRRFRELQTQDPGDEEYNKTKQWLWWATELPYDNICAFEDTCSNYLQGVSHELDNNLYGMKEVKEQILVFLNTKIRSPHMKGCSLGLIGPPGVGKTEIIRSMAKIIKRPFEKISFGGIHDITVIKGSDSAYIGSHPGLIVKSLKKMRVKNGILLFDEYEKACINEKIGNAMLDITDPDQNDEFRDDFFPEIKIDLSQLWIAYSMNELPINRALRDRLFVVKVKGYQHHEKVRIIIDYIFPKYLEKMGIPKDNIKVSDAVAGHIIDRCSSFFEKGVREITRVVQDLVRKLSFLINNPNKSFEVAKKELSFILPHEVKLPLTLTEKMVNTLTKQCDLDQSLAMMYM